MPRRTVARLTDSHATSILKLTARGSLIGREPDACAPIVTAAVVHAGNPSAGIAP